MGGARRAVSSASPLEPRFGFSRGVRVGAHVAIGGCAPIEADGTNTAGDVRAQARRCLAIVAAALAGLDARMADVVRTRIYVTRAEDAAAVGEVHGEAFAGIRPVITIVVVTGFVDPAWLVEIEADAVVGDPA